MKITGTRTIITVIDLIPYLYETESKGELMCRARAAISCLFSNIYLVDPLGIYMNVTFLNKGIVSIYFA